jgi:hypothetical protein
LVAGEEGPDLATVGATGRLVGPAVHLDVSRQQVKDSPTYDASTTVDRIYEHKFHSYYGGAPPTDQP